MPPHTYIFLPIGISFYTFMAISYLVEVYQGKDKCASLLTFGTYLTLFPHLVAGPIVRYSELEAEMENRKITLEMFFEGIWRFSLGMGKKIILANSLGGVGGQNIRSAGKRTHDCLGLGGSGLICCRLIPIFPDIRIWP